MSAAHESVERIYAQLMRSGTGEPFSASDVACPGDGDTIYFIGSVSGDRPSDPPAAKVYRSDRAGNRRILHDGPARLLSPSASGEHIAFVVADQATARDQLMVMTIGSGALATVPGAGRIEQIDWSPDGQALLALIAGEGTDTTTLAGSIGGSAAGGGDTPDPVLDNGTPDPRDWRRLYIHRLGQATLVPGPDVAGMIWEATWCGTDSLAILHSDTIGEAAWYRAAIGVVDLATAGLRIVFRPVAQLGHVQGHPEGASIAFVEGVASDRGLVCGQLKLVDVAGDTVEQLDTGAVEITSVAWRGNALHLAGLAGLQTVIGDYDLAARRFLPSWSATAWSCGAFVPTSRPVGADAAIAVIESYADAPRIAIIGSSGSETICLAPDDAAAPDVLAEPVEWDAGDGTTIEAILIRPVAAIGPMPLVVDIHGGPIWAYRARWQGRQRATPALAAAGIAVLCPNPRGSFGRGQPFSRAVLGDMGGADARDILAGIDHLVAQGVADPDRIGLTGSSYGGYMSAWLPKLRQRIAAAVCISPVSNWFSQHFTSNMPILEEIFIGGRPGEAGAEYLARSPALSAAKTCAATLILAGARDRCTPIGQAIELHRALLEQGSQSVLATYPREGHGVRSPFGALDSAARSLDWFARHLLG